MSIPKIPLNLFGIPFGLAGLGDVWTISASHHHSPEIVADVILLVSAAVWLVVVVAYLGHLVGDGAALVRDVLDPVAAPFASLALITPMLLASTGLYPHAQTTGRTITDIFLSLTVLLGGWLTGQWIYRPLDVDKLHPGYFLPTVAGGLIGSAAAAAVGQQRLAEVMFGLGFICWIVLGSIILGRLLLRPMLPPALQPTLAIEVAPAAVASLAWFQIYGDRIDLVIAFLAGYETLMVLAQLRLIPAYRRLPFMPSTWAFTFSWTAVASTAFIWLEGTHVAGYRIWQYLILALITVFIARIAARTVMAIGRRQLLPAPASIAVLTTSPPVASPRTADTVDRAMDAV